MTAGDRGAGILFLCMGNSIRSPMAEGFAREIAPAGVEVCSAGISPGRIHPLAVALMEEVGIDLRSHVSRGLDAVPWDRITMVVSLSREASRLLGDLPGGVERRDWAIDVPDLGSDPNLRLRSGRRIRDEIRRRVAMLLPPSPPPPHGRAARERGPGAAGREGEP